MREPADTHARDSTAPVLTLFPPSCARLHFICVCLCVRHTSVLRCGNLKMCCSQAQKLFERFSWSGMDLLHLWCVVYGQPSVRYNSASHRALHHSGGVMQRTSSGTQTDIHGQRGHNAHVYIMSAFLILQIAKLFIMHKTFCLTLGFRGQLTHNIKPSFVECELKRSSVSFPSFI